MHRKCEMEPHQEKFFLKKVNIYSAEKKFKSVNNKNYVVCLMLYFFKYYTYKFFFIQSQHTTIVNRLYYYIVFITFSIKVYELLKIFVDDFLNVLLCHMISNQNVKL